MSLLLTLTLFQLYWTQHLRELCWKDWIIAPLHLVGISIKIAITKYIILSSYINFLINRNNSLHHMQILLTVSFYFFIFVQPGFKSKSPPDLLFLQYFARLTIFYKKSLIVRIHTAGRK